MSASHRQAAITRTWRCADRKINCVFVTTPLSISPMALVGSGPVVAAPDSKSREVERTAFAPLGWEWLGVSIAIAIYLVVAIMTIRMGSPLGHDESVYAVRAREFLNGEPAASWFSGNRAPGLPLMLTLAWLGNATEPYLRLVVTMGGMALIVSTWLMGKLMVGRVGGMVAAFGIALTPIILVAATQVWPDVPGAAAGMIALLFYAWGLSSERFRWWVALLVITFIVVATVIRYGAPIPLLIGFAGLTLWRWPRETHRKLMVALVAVGGAIAVGLIVMTPLVSGGAIPGRTISVNSDSNPAFQGFVDYWQMWKRLAAGSVAVGLFGVLVGLIGSFFSRDVRRTFIWPFVIGVATFAAIAAVVHGEARYLSPFFPWFWISAGAGLAALGRLGPRSIGVAAGALAIAVCAYLAPGLSDEGQVFNQGFTTIETAARSLADGEPCGVFTSYTPQVEWYSGCETVVIDQHAVVVDSPLMPDGDTYLFLVEKGKRQPVGELRDAYLAETTGEVTPYGPPGHSLRYVEIWELTD